ncbi:MAG: hypothetical protein EPO21_13910 [Chloroflexota bacterium]|nr:MAG: hypothetical protein EPO21_13910 [Chloroflexota bacterium]
MTELRLAFALIIPLLAGWTALCLLVPLSGKGLGDQFPAHRTMPVLERFSVGYGLGTGILTTTMLLLGLLGMPLTLPIVSMATAGLILLMGIEAVRRKVRLWPVAEPRRWGAHLRIELVRRRPSAGMVLEILLAVGLLYRLVMVWAEVFLRPVFAWDAFTYWSLYAKVLFVEKQLPSQSYQITATGSLSSHPLHVIFLQDWFGLALDQWNDVLINVPFAAYYTALILIIYFGLRRSQSRLFALLFAFLASSLPLLVTHAGVAQGDLPVAYYATAASIYLGHWVTNRRVGFLVLSLVLAVLAAWTKAIGILVLVIILALLVLWVIRDGQVRAWRRLMRYVIPPVAALAAAFIVLRLASFPLPVSLAQRFAFQPDVIELYVRSLLMGGSWGITWGVFLLVTVICWRSLWSPRIFYAFLFTWTGVIAFLGIYLFLPQYHENMLNGTLLDRNTLTFAPASVYCMGLAIAERLRRSPGR